MRRVGRFVSPAALLAAFCVSSSLRADEPAEQPRAAATAKIPITVRDEAGQPLADAQLQFRGRLYGIKFDKTFQTDGDGRLELPISPNAKVEYLYFTCKHPGHTPIHYHWRNDNAPVKLPEKLDLQMPPGAPIVGVVVDEQGAPITGAKVSIHMPITAPKTSHWVFTAYDGTTDEQGRWTWDSAPIELAGLGINITHNDYLRSFGGSPNDRQYTTTLKRGIMLSGRVADAQGQPVARAMVSLGFDRFGTDEPTTITDNDGRFTLKNCKPGKSLVTVQGDKFAPAAQQVTIADTNPDLSFALEPGHTIRFRVVDSAGKPLKTEFAADTWRGYRSLQFRISTDEQGRAEWHSAPPDAVQYDFFKTGYMSVRNLALKARDEEHLITMPAVLVIRGQVTDAATGKPVEKFSVQQGYRFAGNDRIHWPNDEGVKGTDGSYQYKFDEPIAERFLRFVAEGYEPGQSRAFKNDEGQQQFDIQLQPAEWLSGTIVRPDGQPAGGAELALISQERPAYLQNGRFYNGMAAESLKADAQGRFRLAPQKSKEGVIVAVHDSGYGELSLAALKPDEPLRLAAWCSIEGRVLVGREPDANREVAYSPKYRENIHFDYKATTAPDGRFRIDKVVPGKGHVARVVVTQFIRSWQHAPGWQIPVDLEPGASLAVIIGGTGRPVTGQVVLDGTPDVPVDWTTNEPATVNRQRKPDTPEEEGWFRAAASVNGEGRFRIPDVPAGEYELVIPVNNPPVPNACGAGNTIGRARLKFTVPAMTDNRDDEPLDLGTITAKLDDTLQVGQRAPLFKQPQLSGAGDLNLADYKGKLVLVDFWATWCGPCLAEMPAMSEIFAQHGNDPRFAMIGVACDNTPEPAARYVEEKKLPWLHVHVGNMQLPPARDYAIHALPATFLIGPHGKVLAKNLRGDALEKAIAAALADEALFPPAK